MEITESKSGTALVLSFVGRLDAASCNGAQARVNALIDAGERQVVMDLERLNYISSAGLRVFMTAARRLKPLGGQLAFCSLQTSTQELFEISGFASLFPQFPTQKEALKAVAKG
ncbi:MAG TPA: STAS domain-containing protein [Candidatus Limnocylindria bacterium]|jgi:anti-anti-sigma factor|nr:STAS domain-containing protein [Candidatus Limnocylindria bacterium]